MAYANVANQLYSDNEEKMIFKTKNFIFKMKILESKLDNIEFALAENNTEESKKTIKMIKQYLKILADNSHYFQNHDWLRSNKNIIDSVDPNQKNEIQSLRKYLRSRRWVYHNLCNQADMLNMYWYVKAESDILEEIHRCLESFKKELATKK